MVVENKIKRFINGLGLPTQAMIHKEYDRTLEEIFREHGLTHSYESEFNGLTGKISFSCNPDSQRHLIERKISKYFLGFIPFHETKTIAEIKSEATGADIKEHNNNLNYDGLEIHVKDKKEIDDIKYVVAGKLEKALNEKVKVY